MARAMKTPGVPRGPRKELLLTIYVDPLRVRRGVRHLPAGGVHRSARQPGRARARHEVRRQLSGG